jgi:hypothetical protein
MAEPTVSTAPAASKRKIHPSRFKLAEHVVNTHCIVVEQGVPFEAMSDPAYWSHIASRLRPGDEIKVRTDDGAYAATLLVKDVAHQAVRVVPVWYVSLSEVAELPANAEYEVAWAGPHHKFRITRKKDNAVIQSGFDNREAAIAAMATHIRDMAA